MASSVEKRIAVILPFFSSGRSPFARHISFTLSGTGLNILLISCEATMKGAVQLC